MVAQRKLDDTEEKNTKDKLKSDAIGLTGAFLDEAANSNDADPTVVTMLQRARDAIWKGEGSVEQVASQIMSLFKPHKDTPEEQTLNQRNQFMRGFTRMGQLYDLSTLHTRERAIEESRQNVINKKAEPLSGGVRDMLGSVEDYKTAVRYLNRPVLEVVMTAHPTNVNAKENIDNLRRLGNALHADFMKDHNERSLSTASRTAMHAYANDNRLIPEKNGLPGSISVSDEIDQVIYYLGNIYKNLPAVYASFEEPLQEKATKSGQEYNPQDIFLNMRYSSWGSSGDKDGNSKVTAETTLEAIIKHKLAVVKLYSEDLRGMVAQEQAGHKNILQNTPELKKWRVKLNHAEQNLTRLLQVLNEKKSPDGFLPPEEFNTISGQLSEIGLNRETHNDFVNDLNTAYHAVKAKGGLDKPVLDLWRKARTFDFNFARIEYRETAEEYERVIAHLLPEEYGTLCDQAKAAKEAGDDEQVKALEAQKCAVLSEKIQQDGFVESMQPALKDMMEQGKGKPYSKEDATPIGYHTLKRMELARDFPEMITANVLAECQNASNILEAVLLQKLSTKGDSRAVMGVVPLFEEPDTMKRVDSILQNAYNNTAYMDHLNLVAGHMKSLGLSQGEQTQQVQIAHSDNTRRSGLPAARAFIYDAHEKIRALNDQYGIKTQFFEGGSNSDPFRGGVRSISAATNMYKLHDFMKFTFQGGDNLGYFNYPGSITRLYARNLSHAAKYLAMQELGTPTNHVERTHCGADAIKDNPRINQIALRVLKSTLDDYKENVFREDKMGFFLWITRDDYGNTSSRAGSRKPMDITKETIDPDEGMRTITFSESFQHAGIVPTWIGAHTIEQSLRAELDKLEPTKSGARSRLGKVIELGGVDVLIPSDPSVPLDPMIYRQLYRLSSVFCDVIDRMAFGLAMTDLDHITDYYPALAKDDFLQKRLKPEFREAVNLVTAALPNNSVLFSLNKDKEQLNEDKNPKTQAVDTMATIAARSRPLTLEELKYRTQPGLPMEKRTQMWQQQQKVIFSPDTSYTRLSQTVREQLPHLSETMNDKRNFMRLAQMLKRNWREDWDAEGKPTDTAKQEPTKLSHLHQWAMSLGHAVIDCVTHGRMMLADDPMAMRMFFPNYYETMIKNMNGFGKQPTTRAL